MSYLNVNLAHLSIIVQQPLHSCVWSSPCIVPQDRIGRSRPVTPANGMIISENPIMLWGAKGRNRHWNNGCSHIFRCTSIISFSKLVSNWTFWDDFPPVTTYHKGYQTRPLCSSQDSECQSGNFLSIKRPTFSCANRRSLFVVNWFLRVLFLGRWSKHEEARFLSSTYCVLRGDWSCWSSTLWSALLVVHSVHKLLGFCLGQKGKVLGDVRGVLRFPFAIKECWQFSNIGCFTSVWRLIPESELWKTELASVSIGDIHHYPFEEPIQVPPFSGQKRGAISISGSQSYLMDSCE